MIPQKVHEVDACFVDAASVSFESLAACSEGYGMEWAGVKSVRASLWSTTGSPSGLPHPDFVVERRDGMFRVQRWGAASAAGVEPLRESQGADVLRHPSSSRQDSEVRCSGGVSAPGDLVHEWSGSSDLSVASVLDAVAVTLIVSSNDLIVAFAAGASVLEFPSATSRAPSHLGATLYVWCGPTVDVAEVAATLPEPIAVGSRPCYRGRLGERVRVWSAPLEQHGGLDAWPLRAQLVSDGSWVLRPGSRTGTDLVTVVEANNMAQLLDHCEARFPIVPDGSHQMSSWIVAYSAGVDGSTVLEVFVS